MRLAIPHSTMYIFHWKFVVLITLVYCTYIGDIYELFNSTLLYGMWL